MATEELHKIIVFLNSCRCLTLATVSGNQPYSANCFYALDEINMMLVFKSSADTRHIMEAIHNTNVAGTVLPDVSKVAEIKGIQFTAKFIIPDESNKSNFKKAYYKKYPFAATVPGELWAAELLTIKMTDNTLGFGKKIYWEKSR